jgi:hypothetical protein
MTVDEARAAGLLGQPAKAAKVRTTRKTVASVDCSNTRCRTCREEFPRQVDEDRHHAANPTHAQYEVIL